MTSEQSVEATADPATRQRVADEIADVFLFLVQVADHTGIDIAQAVRDKLVVNAHKYPVPGQAPLVLTDDHRPR